MYCYVSYTRDAETEKYRFVLLSFFLLVPEKKHFQTICWWWSVQQ